MVNPRLIISAILLLPVALAVVEPARAETGVATSAVFSMNTGVSAAPDAAEVPGAHSLDRVFPNPFNPSVTIAFSLAGEARVKLAVYDLRGRLVQILVDDELMAAGPARARWLGRDQAGRAVAGGVYLCRLTLDEQIFNRRLTLLK